MKTLVKKTIFFIYQCLYPVVNGVRNVVAFEKDQRFRRQFRSIAQTAHVDRHSLVTNPQFISIGEGFNALHHLRLDAIDRYMGKAYTPSIVIGDNVSFNSDCHIGAIDRITIGNNVLLASRVYISDHFHGEISSEALAVIPILRDLYSKGPVVIGDNVWIGEGACILPGVTVGRNAIIGANAVVTKDVPENAVVGGIPAKIIKMLS